VAKFFSNKEGIDIEWMKSGPDLKVIMERGVFYVECYTYRKSFGIKEFIEELLHRINPQIRVTHVPCTPFSLSKGPNCTEAFLDELFRPYLDPVFLESKVREAHKEYPILLPKPNFADNLQIYLEGNEPTNYVPGKLKMCTGDPEIYLRHAIKEALDNKRKSNRLQNYHPNLIAINYLLDTDFQMAFHRQKDLHKAIPLPDLGTPFDAVLLAACGIDEFLSMDRVYLKVEVGQDHPILGISGVSIAVS
jgi:hypothetical protein